MPAVDSFPTRRGTARFTDDAVRFDESTVRYLRSLSREYWHRDARWRKAIFVGYVLALVVALGWVVSAVQSGDVVRLAVVGGVLVALRVVDYTRGFRSPARIRLDAIEDVSATRGEKGLTRPRLVVTYTDGDSTYRRRVTLPSLYTTAGETAYERARTAFAERGF